MLEYAHPSTKTLKFQGPLNWPQTQWQMAHITMLSFWPQQVCPPPAWQNPFNTTQDIKIDLIIQHARSLSVFFLMREFKWFFPYQLIVVLTHTES